MLFSGMCVHISAGEILQVGAVKGLMVCTNYCMCVCITKQSLDTRGQNSILVICIMQNNLIKVLLQFTVLEMCVCACGVSVHA